MVMVTERQRGEEGGRERGGELYCEYNLEKGKFVINYLALDFEEIIKWKVKSG